MLQTGDNTVAVTHQRFTVLMRVVSILLATLLALLAGCASLPPNTDRTVTTAISSTAKTSLGESLAPLIREHNQQSAFYPLSSGLDAFLARLAFADVAEKTIDVQYYLFHDDAAGRALTDFLLRAADRGVRVRVLLDDMDMRGKDAGLATLALHPNVDIRLFNPFPSRSLRHINFLTHFGTVTRRMHNKSFIVDNQVAIVGGRNIGDEYFEAATETNFGDMDVLAAGPIVFAVSDAFDMYWNSDLAFPAEALGAKGDPKLLAEASEALKTHTEDLGESGYGDRLRDSNLAKALANNDLPLVWANAYLLVDRPEKVLNDPDDTDTHLGPELRSLMQSASNSLLIVSPYFVPGKTGSEFLINLAQQGIAITVVTNSLASTDVTAVHAGYARYRRRLLEAGIEIFEILDTRVPQGSDPRLGSSHASLHAKTFAIDDQRIIVGSMNMDPRSAQLNTELGIVIDSPELASQLLDWRQTQLPRQAWQLSLETVSEDGSRRSKRLIWTLQSSEGDKVHRGSEPEASLWRRFGAAFFGLLPIESQL